MNVNDLVAINIYQFYHDLYQFNILIINSFTDIAITLQFGGHLGNMQIRQRKRHFSACRHWFLDSAYPSTPNRDIKPFSSQNACTFMRKRLFWIISRTTSFGSKITIYSTLAVLLMYFLCQDQDQDSLLVKRRNDNHSPGPVIRELVPSSHQRSELSNTILCIFSG